MISFDEFKETMRAAGLEPPANLTADGQIHRFHVVGDKPRTENGWYVIFADDPVAGAFGCWKRGITEKWCAVRSQVASPEEQVAIKAKFEELRRIRELENEKRSAEARAKAALIYNSSEQAKNDHPYLTRKIVEAFPGLKCSTGALVLPVRDAQGQLHGLQFIDEEGEKRFLTGTAKRGCYFSIGRPKEIVCLAEGYATAASIHQATGHAVAVAFDAGNLHPVAIALRSKFPRALFVFCADNDPSGVGQTKAGDAAHAIRGIATVPVFKDSWGNPTDFNDLHVREGLEAVRDQISSAIGKASRFKAKVSISQDEPWGEPGVIEPELLPVPAFDPEILLPEPLRDWMVDESDRMPVPVEFVAAPGLAALGSVVGTRCAILPKQRDVWIVVPNIWSAIVGLPSAKKSPAMSAVLRPLDVLSAREARSNSNDLQNFEALLVVQQAREEAIQARIRAAAKDSKKGDPEEIARELLELKQKGLEPPVKRRYKTNDCTIEKLGEILQDNPLGVLVMRDELTGLLASMDKAGHEGDRAFYLEGWNGTSSYDTDRIGRGSQHIENLCITVTGGIQPDKLLSYLEQASHSLGNDGLLQRLQLLVYPDHRSWQWRDRAPNIVAQSKAFRIFEALDIFDPADWGASPPDERIKFPHFCFDEEAQEVFKAWATELHGQKLPGESHPIVAQHLAKYDKLFPALALIFHLVECASGTPRPKVSVENSIRAAAWCEFLEAHARRCYGLLVDDGLRAAQTLAMHIRNGKLEDGFTVRGVRRNQWRHLTTTEAIQSALEWLVDENYVRSEHVSTGPRGGRPTTAYRINPVLLLDEKTK